MRVAYIAETSINNKSAYTHHVIKMCDAFCAKNNKVILIIPSINKKLSFKRIRKKFLLTSKKNFLIKAILNFKVSNFLSRLLFGYKVANYLSKNCPELIITRSFISSIFFTCFKINHFLEIHSEFKGLTRFLMINLNFLNSKYILKIILISKALNKKIFKLKKKNFLTLHDAVDIKNFKNKKFDNKIKTATYVGSFYKGKGVEFILQLAERFKELEFNLYGDSKKNFYNISKNVKIHGYVNYDRVPHVLSKSDILLLPSAHIQYGRSKSVNIANYNSPLKMFDYLASGKIIVSSKRDGICEVLKHNYNAIVVKEYNVEVWIKCLKKILGNKYNLKKIRLNSLKTAKKFTWKSRVNKILLAHKSLI